MKLRCAADSNPIAPTINQLALQTLPHRPCPQMSSGLISARFSYARTILKETGTGRALLFADRLRVNGAADCRARPIS